MEDQAPDSASEEFLLIEVEGFFCVNSEEVTEEVTKQDDSTEHDFVWTRSMASNCAQKEQKKLVYHRKLPDWMIHASNSRMPSMASKSAQNENKLVSHRKLPEWMIHASNSRTVLRNNCQRLTRAEVLKKMKRNSLFQL